MLVHVVLSVLCPDPSEPPPAAGVLGCVAGRKGPGRQSSLAFLQNRLLDLQDPCESSDANRAGVRGILPLELRGMWSYATRSRPVHLLFDMNRISLIQQVRDKVQFSFIHQRVHVSVLRYAERQICRQPDFGSWWGDHSTVAVRQQPGPISHRWWHTGARYAHVKTSISKKSWICNTSATLTPSLSLSSPGFVCRRREVTLGHCDAAWTHTHRSAHMFSSRPSYLYTFIFSSVLFYFDVIS